MQNVNRGTGAFASLIAMAVAGGMPAEALAQAEPAAKGQGAIEDIVVTAQRREERLQDVPITIAAVTGQTLQNAGVQGVTDLGSAVPGLVIAPQNASLSTFIRGIGGTNTTPGDESHVAIYVDGVYLASPAAGVFSLSNVERVEVLKGPQGTLFGRNATAGVIQVITRDPSHDPSIDLSLGYANYDRRELSFYGTTGLSENLAVDLAAYAFDQRDGWGKNLVSGKDVYKGYEVSLRNKWLLTLGDDTDVTFAANYDKHRPVAPPAYTPPRTGALVGGVTNAGFYTTLSNRDVYALNEQWGGSLTVNHDFGGARLLSITSYQHVDSFFQLDSDSTPALTQQADSLQYQKTWTQEVQILSPAGSAIDWIAGLYFFHDDSAADPLRRQSATATSFLYAGQKTTSYAAFGQATIGLLPATNLIAGFRYTQDEREISSRTVSAAGTTLGPDQKSSSGKPTWRLSLDHHFTDDTMVYASYGRGFKSGLFSTFAPAGQAVHPETVDAYEVGLKAELFDRRVRFNAAAFYNKFKDIQLSVPILGGSIFQNAAAGETEGAEFDMEAVPVPGFTLRAGATYMDTRFTDFTNAQFFVPRTTGGNAQVIADATGNEFVRAPHWTGYLSARYAVETESGDFALSPSLNYNSGFYYDPQNRVRQPSYILLNLALDWESSNGRWGARLWGRNLTQKHYYANIVPQVFGDTSLPAAPRTYGVTLSLHL